jgi:hypothetical protein
MLQVDCVEFEASSGKNGMHMLLVFIGTIIFPIIRLGKHSKD